MSKSKLLWLIVSLLIMGLSCGKDKNPTAPPTVKDDPAFATDIQPIFTAHCALSGCHNSTARAGMNLSDGKAYDNIVNVGSTQDNTKKRVLPNDADNSYLVMKIEGRQTVGIRMPQGGTLSDDNVQLIKNWINKGAKNN
ncbi:MAG TPA: hypothetical protein VGD14_04230 [bacterium]